MSFEFERTPWKEKTEKISTKEDFLNGLEYEDVNPHQQMFYLAWKKIEDLEERIKKMEEKYNVRF